MSELVETSKSPQGEGVENLLTPTTTSTHVRPKWLDFEAADYDMSANRRALSCDSNKPTTTNTISGSNVMRHSQYASQSPNFAMGIIKSPQSVSPSSSSTSAATFIPDVPQWKKDLILRRKSNVGRSSMVAQDTLTSSDDVNATTVSPVLLKSSIHIPNCTNSHVVVAASDYQGSMIVFDHADDDNDDCVADKKVPTRERTTSQQKQRPKQEQPQTIGIRNQTNATLAPPLFVKNGLTAAVVVEQQGEEPQQKQQAKIKMPASNSIMTATTIANELTIATTATTLGATLIKSPTSPSIREKAEKLLCAGGHYTPTANDRVRHKSVEDFTLLNKSANSMTTDVAVGEHEILAAATTTTTTNHNNNHNSISSSMQNQRSLYLTTSPSSSSSSSTKTTKSSTMMTSSSSFSSFSTTRNINSTVNNNNNNNRSSSSGFENPIALKAKKELILTTITTKSSLPVIMASTSSQLQELQEIDKRRDANDNDEYDYDHDDHDDDDDDDGEEKDMQEILKRKPKTSLLVSCGEQIPQQQVDEVDESIQFQLCSQRDSEYTSNSPLALNLTSVLTSTTTTAATTIAEITSPLKSKLGVQKRHENKQISKITPNISKSAIYGVNKEIIILSANANDNNDESGSYALLQHNSPIKSIKSNSISKLFNTLQDNQFVKSQQKQQQQQQQQQEPQPHSPNKANLADSQEEFNQIAIATITTTSVTGSSPTKQKLVYASAVASASGVSSNNHHNNKKKMVAMQEMKKTTQNVSHHHHHHHLNNQRHHQQIIGGNNNVNCGADADDQQQQTNNNHVSYDSGEDLCYGPGIVEKLRDRYLSWATRESMVEKQRRSLETLRRATSLCTLLDRDQALDDDDDEEDDENGVENDYDDIDSDLVEKPMSEIIKVPPITPIPAQRHSNYKSPSGILKTTTTATNAPTTIDAMKKTAKFENNGSEKENDESPLNGEHVENMSRSQNENGGRGSRAIKRGNDSMKRARSVEALLSERAAWNFVPKSKTLVQTTAVISTAGRTPPVNNNKNHYMNNGGVTIEDKIYNARDRLIMGTDIMPPKRLTSIIDETERPPPDLVKLTLKKFEATANRRPRVTRDNSKGDVASKVATFKSKMNEQQKPAIVLPKPTSPIKRQLEVPNVKPVAKPVILPAEGTLQTSPTTYRVGNNNNHKNIGLSEHAPDLIPRQKHLLLNAANSNTTANATDSPVTALTKKMERMRIKNEGNGMPTNAPTTAIDSPMTALTKRIEKMRISTENRTEKMPQATDTTACDQSAIVAPSHDNDNNSSRNNLNDINLINSNGKSKQFGVDDGAVGAAADIGYSNYKDSNVSDMSAVAVAANACDRKRHYDDVSNSAADKHIDTQTHGAVMTARTVTAAATATATATAAADDVDTVETGICSPSSVFSDDEDSLGLTKRVTRRALDNIAKAGTTLQFKFANDSLLENHNNSNNNKPAINNMRPLINSATSSSAATTVRQKTAAFVAPLTSREIEKNRINELKKTDHNSSASASVPPANVSSPNSGQSELDASGSVSASPIWGTMCKRRIAPPAAVVENTSMVFNFSNRKEVPDYIENDGVIFRRKRELPKPNESGFVMLGDLTVETSTDSDCDDFSMCPPSPCDVEFENANIVIDGKSSIRQKAKDAAASRVQFNDTLTSTFEYPSESSLVIDNDDSFQTPYGHHRDADSSLLSAYENLVLEESDSPTHQRHAHHHHHVAVDEIIPLPNYTHQLNNANNTSMNNSSATTNTNTPTKNVLGNLPLGSAPLGLYTPVKAPIDNLFQLGVTRAPITNGHSYSQSGDGVSVIGTADGLTSKTTNGVNNEAPDSLQNHDITLAYSEGTQKTDLLY